MTSFRILPEASEELEACVNYYNSQQSNLGTEFLAEFEKAAERILELPNAARIVGEGIRSRPIHRFPFYVLYRSLEKKLQLSLLHIDVGGPDIGLAAHSRLTSAALTAGRICHGPCNLLFILALARPAPDAGASELER
jgi:hypothetical protein